MTAHPPVADFPPVYIVDDDSAVRNSLLRLFREQGMQAYAYDSGEDFLRFVGPDQAGCLVLDVRMPGISGVETLACLSQRKDYRPTVLLSGYAETQDVVLAMKLGAVNFFDKPVPPYELLRVVRECLTAIKTATDATEAYSSLRTLLAALTFSEKAIIRGMIRGMTNQAMADDQNVSLRTLQLRRRNLKDKLQVRTKEDLFAMLNAAGWDRD